MPKGVPNRRYSAEFKVKVIETMRAEGPEGFSVERRGHSGSGRPLKRVSQDREKKLLAHVQRLEAENRYLKKLWALVLEDEQRQRKKRG